MPSSRAPSDPGIEPGSPTRQADSLPSEPPGKPSPREEGHTDGGQVAAASRMNEWADMPSRFPAVVNSRTGAF